MADSRVWYRKRRAIYPGQLTSVEARPKTSRSSGENVMSRIMISQSILWAAAIIVTAISDESDWLWLTVLAVMALGTLKNLVKET